MGRHDNRHKDIRPNDNQHTDAQ
jgi:hypothetical protein